MSDGTDRTPYEIGLTMAGAASAGAYAAGVVDFLIEALDQWHQAKEERPDEVPNHEVRLKVMSGSSAGGMTGAIAAGLLSGSHTPITTLPGKEPAESVWRANPLYSAWVEQIDIRPLLGHADLSSPDNQVVSLLDSSVLSRIAETAIDFTPRDEPRDYVADPLHLFLTITNLKGVPYDITFESSQDVPHRTFRHTDYKEFALSRAMPDGEDARRLAPSDPRDSGWNALRQYALATGAFPGGLAPRALSRPRADYDDRRWTVPPAAGEEDGTRRSIEPSWPEGTRDDEYRFLAVDGGAMNNEPFRLARRKLAGTEGSLEGTPKQATRSVLMVDPLPSDPIAGMEGLQDRSLPAVLTGLFDSLIEQTRFKPDELALAHSEEDYSRYMIVPTRRDQNEEKVSHPIASEMLGGFGGFLKKRFRMHDFQLGRRNCQQFLRKYYGIPRPDCSNNPVFAHYDAADLDKFIDKFGVKRDGTGVMPIIPLVGDVASEEFPLRWKTLEMTDRELKELKARIDDRTGRVLDRMVDRYVDGWAWSGIAQFAAGSLAQGRIVDGILSKVEASLEEYDLKT
jgi:hypothetical protein